MTTPRPVHGFKELGRAWCGAISRQSHPLRYAAIGAPRGTVTCKACLKAMNNRKEPTR